MKNILKLFIAVAGLFLYSACHKVDDLPNYGNGHEVVLSSSTNAVAAPASDSNNAVISFSWTDPAYAQDPSLYKFDLQIDSSGRGFADKKAVKTITGASTTSMTGKELNAILLGWGFAFNTAYTVDVRVISSYGNNNEAYASNTLSLSVTPYKIPPKIPVPAALYLVGDINGWNNNPGLDTKYQFSLIDETTYAGVFNFTGGGAYKLIQTLGVWGTQFHMVAGGTATAGEFVQQDADPGFPNPSTPGWYRVTVDFQHATYKVTPAPARVPTPANLYIVGDLNGWNNSSGLDPIYKFTHSATDPFVHTINVSFPGGGGYKLIQELGNWDTQFHMISGGNSSFGEFVQENADPTFPGPVTAGSYKVTVNFAANYYWVIPN